MRAWIYALLISSLAGQAGWKVRLDRPGFSSGEPAFVSIPPGWQITTGPSAIAYEPGSSARGNFRVESEMLLFPGNQNEGYGLFLGGDSLDSNDLSYTAFQLRRDGKFSIWFRKGATTRDIVAWTAHPAITPHSGGVEPVKNILAVEARAGEVAFFVNGRTVHIGRRTALVVEGNFGFRVHDDMNVHATNLSLKSLP